LLLALLQVLQQRETQLGTLLLAVPLLPAVLQTG
jgi:hypothetical protein